MTSYTYGDWLARTRARVLAANQRTRVTSHVLTRSVIRGWYHKNNQKRMHPTQSNSWNNIWLVRIKFQALAQGAICCKEWPGGGKFISSNMREDTGRPKEKDDSTPLLPPLRATHLHGIHRAGLRFKLYFFSKRVVKLGELFGRKGMATRYAS